MKQTQRDGVAVHETGDGTVEIEIVGPVDAALEQALSAVVPETERGRINESFGEYRKLLSPAERGEQFDVPRLMSELQGELEFADTDVFLESHDWSLLSHAPQMDEGEFTIRETAHRFEVDIDGRHVTYRFTDEEEQLALNIDVAGWTPEALVVWLDRQVRQPDIGQGRIGEVAFRPCQPSDDRTEDSYRCAHAVQVHPGAEDRRQDQHYSTARTEERLPTASFYARSKSRNIFRRCLLIQGRDVSGPATIPGTLEAGETLFRPGPRSGFRRRGRR